MARNLSIPSDGRECCRRSAMEDPDGAFCMECGQPLLRCMAFQECGGILDRDGRCTVCIAPRLIIIPGATMRAPVGGSVAVPFNLQNMSQVDRPLFVRGVWIKEKGDWREEKLGWEKLGPGEHAPATVTACEFDRAGLHGIEIMFAVATRWRTREECYAFSTQVRLDVAGDRSESGPTVQITSENQVAGNIIQFKERERQPGDDGKVVDALAMDLTRVENFERKFGLRGIGSDTYCPRSALFEFRGFDRFGPDAQPLPIVSPSTMLTFGRSDYRDKGGDSDVRLLLHSPEGAADADRSAPISRRHFNIFIENDRPILRVEGRNGLRVNGEAYGPEKRVVLAHGDVISPLVHDPDALKLSVEFKREFERIARIIITRTPAEPKGEPA